MDPVTLFTTPTPNPNPVGRWMWSVAEGRNHVFQPVAKAVCIACRCRSDGDTYDEIIVLGIGTHSPVLPIINSCTCAATPAVPA